MSAKRGRKSSGRSAAVSSFEGLEPRLLLSGDVLASVSGGNLYLTGDVADNDVNVVNTGSGAFTVQSGIKTATTINGGSDPVPLTGVTGSIFASMGDGLDRVLFTVNLSGSVGDSAPNVAGSIVVDGGLGDNRVHVNDYSIGGSFTYVNAAGNTYLDLDNVTVANGVTVLNGPGTSEIEINDTTAGSLLVVNPGVSNVPANVGGGSSTVYATKLKMYQASIGGNVTIINGLGNDKIHIAASSIGGDTYINNGPDGSHITIWEGTFDGSLTILKGPGGDVSAPDFTPVVAGASGSTSSHSSDVIVASYLKISSTDISGNLYVQNSLGADEFDLHDFTVNGNVFLDGANGPLLIVMDNLEIDGTTVMKGEGSSDLLPTPDGGSVGQLTDVFATAIIIGFADDKGAASSSPAGTKTEYDNSFGGDVTVLQDFGNDAFAVEDTEFFGNLFVLDGPDAAAFYADSCAFDMSILFVKGDGGDINPTDSVNNGPVGIILPNLASVFGIQNTDIAGSVTIFNGVGNDEIGFDNVDVGGSIFDLNVSGAVDFGIADSGVTGALTVLNGGGTGGLVFTGVSANPVSMNTFTGIGICDLFEDEEVCSIGGNVTIVNGPGNDEVVIDESEIGGDTLISNGPDGAFVEITGSGSTLDGSLTILRGDGGSVPVIGAGQVGIISGASYTDIHNSSVADAVLIVNGAGDDEVTTSGSAFGDDFFVFNGLGEQYVELEGTFGSEVWVVDPIADVSNVYLGGAAVGAASIAGDVWIVTGAAADTVETLNTEVDGTTTFDTAAGNDYVRIDDSSFTGAVSITTGPAFVATGTDADKVKIERQTGDSGTTTFTSMLTISTGAGDDLVKIGREGNANCVAHFLVSASADGGPGTDTLDYLANGNVFSGGSVLNNVNFETVT